MLLNKVLCLLAAIGSASAAFGELTPEQVRQAKRATALVEMPVVRTGLIGPVRTVGHGKGFGSAFCIERSGLFVTNAHVADAAVNGEMKLILNASEKDQQVVAATVFRSEQSLDLALLKVKDAKDLTALELDSLDRLTETQQVVAMGFPFGGRLALQQDEYPSISINTGRITSLRKRQGELEVIQLDAALNPGNSGGPVLNAETGRVIGIVRSGVLGSGVNFAIPVSRLDALLKKPEVVFSPAPIPSAKLRQENEFSAKITCLSRVRPDYVVTAVITAGEHRSEVAAKPGEGNIYRFKVVPVPGPAAPIPLQVSAKFSKGTVTGNCADQVLKINDQNVSLSEIRQIEPGEKLTVHLHDGKQFQVRPEDLKPLPVDLGGVQLNLDLAKAQGVLVNRLDQPIRGIQYVLSVSLRGEELIKTQGIIDVVDPAATRPVQVTSRPSAAGFGEARLEQDKVVRPLPGTVDDVVAGARGRLLFLRMAKLRKIAVFDVVEAKIVKLIPMMSEDMTIAAGSDKLFLANREPPIIQRWDLKTLERDGDAKFPEFNKLAGIELGHASSGPMLIRPWDGSTRFVDVETLKLANVSFGSSPYGFSPGATPRWSVRVSADGSTFTAWERGTEARVLKLTGLSARTLCLRMLAPGSLIPSYDGSVLLSSAGTYSTDLKDTTPDHLRNVYCFPAYRPGYFLGARETSSRLMVFNAADRRLLLTLPDIEIPRDPVNRTNAADWLPVDKRIHLIPDANVLVTLNAAADELILRRVNLMQLLEKEGGDYLFVASVPPAEATRGQTWSYQPEIRSKRGSVKVSLDSGPPGMTISPAGVVQWSVPQNLPAQKTSIVLSICDASGQEIFHTFTLEVR